MGCTWGRKASAASWAAWVVSLCQRAKAFPSGGLRKLAVPLAHRPERARRRGAHHLVGVGSKLPAGLFGPHGHRDDQLAGALLPDRGDRGTHGRPRREAVVDDDHRSSPKRCGWARAAIEALAAHQLGLFTLDRGGQGFGRNAHAGRRVHHTHAAARDRAHRKLLVAGIAELADHEDVQRRLQCMGDLEPDGDTAARQCEHEQVLPPPQVFQLLREYAAGLAAVVEGQAHLVHRTLLLRRVLRVRQVPGEPC
jgi:hypothetical protein